MGKRAGALAVLLTLLGPLLGARAASESTTFQVDGAHRGYVYGAGVVPPLQKAWWRGLGWGNSYVAIDGGRVFAFGHANGTAPMAYVGAVNLSSDSVAWKQPLGVQHPSDMDLTVDNGRVFTAVSGTDPAVPSQTAIILSAFSEATGAPLWSEALTDQSFPTPIVAANGTLYFEGSGLGGTVYAVRESDGTRLWSTGLFMGNPVTLAGSVVAVAGACGLSYGLSPATGNVVWTHDEGCDGGGTLMASFRGAYLWGDDPAGGGLGRVYNATSGTVAGRFPGYAPAFGYGEAVQAGVDSSGVLEIRAFRSPSLTDDWTFDESDGGSQDPLGSTPLLADGYVFAEGSYGNLWALNPCSGTIAWQGSTGKSAPYFGYDPLPSIAAGDGYLVVPDQTGMTVYRGSSAPTTPAPNCAAAAAAAKP